MDTCICMAESLHCSRETITSLLIDYTPVQNKKLKKIKRSYVFLRYESSEDVITSLIWGREELMEVVLKLSLRIFQEESVGCLELQ